MHKLFLFFVVIFLGLQLSAQDAVSGFVNFDDSKTWKTKIYLSQVPLSGLDNNKSAIPIAITDIQKNGFFKFDKKHLSDSNKIYRLHVERIRKIVNDTVTKNVTFMLSGKDKIQFKKGKSIFGNYSTTNKGDIEWQKLKAFESSLVSQYLVQDERINPRKGFVKDSLQILMVKLIGIKQLESKQLLDKDISENPSYYLDLLEALKESGIDASEYWFLEKRTAYLTQVTLEKELQKSKWLNAFLILVVILSGVFVIKFKKGHVPDPKLSKQEQNVKVLILQGKSNKEIANELFISLSTVKTHITNIYSKLNIASRKELLKKGTGTST
ncbi:response regulator transcription factor [Flagellimonas pacifica]|uniref:Regulatory protein, luxR family n=1 Tax=Flagellimonas pacifica TaxID=1247520 RepID=A0A285MUJ5_9FLAO|nr:LuxR C-terminal-related transcriptional regulator [Allomuricauda parva]SNZ00869.1 regulatory protein, luxR family [Allomuricauda parva]